MWSLPLGQRKKICCVYFSGRHVTRWQPQECLKRQQRHTRGYAPHKQSTCFTNSASVCLCSAWLHVKFVYVTSPNSSGEWLGKPYRTPNLSSHRTISCLPPQIWWGKFRETKQRQHQDGAVKAFLMQNNGDNRLASTWGAIVQGLILPRGRQRKKSRSLFQCILHVMLKAVFDLKFCLFPHRTKFESFVLMSLYTHILYDAYGISMYILYRMQWIVYHDILAGVPHGIVNACYSGIVPQFFPHVIRKITVS